VHRRASAHLYFVIMQALAVREGRRDRADLGSGRRGRAHHDRGRRPWAGQRPGALRATLTGHDQGWGANDVAFSPDGAARRFCR
jgi:hypothetical protein